MGISHKRSERITRKTTLKDVARACDVSPMTVSKMLNGKGGVSKETAKRIWKAVRQLNYTPNLIAKSLRLNKTLTIGVVTSDSSELLFPKMIDGIIEAATASNYSVIIANTKQNMEREDQSIRVLLNKRIDGILLAAPFRVDMERIRHIRSFGIPVVLLMRSSALPVDFAASDNHQGGYELMEYLIGSLEGRTPEFHFIDLPPDHHNGQERRNGVACCLRDHRIDVSGSRSLPVKPSIRDGYEAMKALVASGVRRGTVVCGCDVLAVGAIRAAVESGLRVPADLRIAGFDDIEMLDYLNVPLTTMRQQVQSMGREGVALLLERMKMPDGEPRQLRLPCELVVRQST